MFIRKRSEVAEKVNGGAEKQGGLRGQVWRLTTGWGRKVDELNESCSSNDRGKERSESTQMMAKSLEQKLRN